MANVQVLMVSIAVSAADVETLSRAWDLSTSGVALVLRSVALTGARDAVRDLVSGALDDLRVAERDAAPVRRPGTVEAAAVVLQGEAGERGGEG